MVVTTAIIWLALRIVSAGHEVSIEPLWLAAATTLTLGMALRRESPVERVAPRSLPLRRLTMLLLTVGACLLAGACAVTNPLLHYGFVAYARDLIALLGLAMWSTMTLGTAYTWIFPLAGTALSLAFAESSDPGVAESIYSVLRLPGDESTWPVTWAMAAVIFISGTLLYLHDWAVTVRLGGNPRVSWPLTAAILIPALIQLKAWRGSPRLVWTYLLPSYLFIVLPVAVALGCWLGQERHRRGLVAWQAMSPRRNSGIFAASLVETPRRAFIAAVLSIAALGIMAHGSLLRWDADLAALAILAIIAAALVLGFTLGWFLSQWWFVPLAFVLSLAGYLGAQMDPQPMLHTDPIYARSSDLYCTGSAPQVCASPDARIDAGELAQLADHEYAASGIANSLPQVIYLGDDDMIPPSTDRHRFTVVMGRVQLAHQRYDRATFWRAFDTSAITACGHPEAKTGIGEAMIERSPAAETRPQAEKLFDLFLDGRCRCQVPVPAPGKLHNQRTPPHGPRPHRPAGHEGSRRAATRRPPGKHAPAHLRQPLRRYTLKRPVQGLESSYCSQGATLDYVEDTLPPLIPDARLSGNHAGSIYTGGGSALAYLTDRFNNVPTPNNCAN